jgi:hypothetical protein
MFVYMAAYGGKLAARNALEGNKRRYSNDAMPSVVFTDPQVASVGLTEAEAKAKGYDVKASLITVDNVPRYIAARTILYRRGQFPARQWNRRYERCFHDDDTIRAGAQRRWLHSGYGSQHRRDRDGQFLHHTAAYHQPERDDGRNDSNRPRFWVRRR